MSASLPTLADYQSREAFRFLPWEDGARAQAHLASIAAYPPRHSPRRHTHTLLDGNRLYGPGYSRQDIRVRLLDDLRNEAICMGEVAPAEVDAVIGTVLAEVGL